MVQSGISSGDMVHSAIDRSTQKITQKQIVI